MNVIKQDAMDDKITERCKTCEKQCMQEDLNKSRSCRVEANLDGSNNYWASIEQTKGFSMDWEAIKNAIKRRSKGLIDRPAVERYREVVGIA